MDLRHLRVRWVAEPGAAVAELHGELVEDAEPDIKAIEVVADVTLPIIVDLAAVRSIDAAGWRLLRRLCERIRVTCRNPSSAAKRWWDEGDSLFEGRSG